MSSILSEVISRVGDEQPLSQYHGTVRRAAASLPGVTGFGAGFVTCSDELMGEVQSGFERDVATPLMSGQIPAQRRVFTIRNLGGRAEPGMVGLVSNHFTLNPESTSPTGLVLEVSAHVGRLGNKEECTFGRVDRFGLDSACCGALDALLHSDGKGSTGFAWLGQLHASFGAVRLRGLRAMDPSLRLLGAGIIQAALQAEAIVAEFLRDPPPTPTHLLIFSNVAINQDWSPTVLPVSVQHLRVDTEGPTVVEGFSLRTTPEALHIVRRGSKVRVETGEAMESVDGPRRQEALAVRPRPGDAAAASPPFSTLSHEAVVPPPLPGDPPTSDAGSEGPGAPGSGDDESNEAVDEVTRRLQHLVGSRSAELEKPLARARRQLEAASRDPVLRRTYARPIIKALLQGMSVVSPEVGIAKMLVQGVGGVAHANKLKRILRDGPDSPSARLALHEMEAELQQLNHEDAIQVLEILTAENR